jgi:hypothetical protein
MGYSEKNTDIDLIVAPMPLSIEDRQAISNIIAHYKTTGEKLKSVKKKQTLKPQLVASKHNSRRPLTV